MYELTEEIKKYLKGFKYQVEEVGCFEHEGTLKVYVDIERTYLSAAWIKPFMNYATIWIKPEGLRVTFITQGVLKECKLLKHCIERYGKCGFKGDEAECQLNPDNEEYYRRLSK